MNDIPQPPAECTNLLLSMLADAEYQAILAHFEFIETPLHFILFEKDKPIRYAYFPLIGEHSILATMKDGAAVEGGTVGYE